MTTFLNKKEQVIDFKLTSYGNYLLSIGNFKPTYYAFFDDNVLYDGAYAGLSGERQNDIHERIKQKTQYLEGMVLFEDVEKLVSEGGHEVPGLMAVLESGLGMEHAPPRELFFEADLTPTKVIPRKDNFRFESMIGDAFLDGETQSVPAWKIATLQGDISSSSTADGKNEVSIPQLNIELRYIKRVVEFEVDVDPESVRALEATTAPFIDNKSIVLEMDDAVIYTEEVNTELLTENFDIEVFEILSGSTIYDSSGDPIYALKDTYKRKYFEKTNPQIINGFMVSETTIENSIQMLTTSSVEYYFDLLTDREVNQQIACRGSDIFNKQSYYIDLDFECEKESADDVFFDIYGKVTEPEICPD